MSSDVSAVLMPRVIRLKDAATYLGMDRQLFNHYVRPQLTQIPIGGRGIGFDRLDLDQWFSDHKRCNGIPATNTKNRRNSLWQKRERQGSTNVRGSGTLINNSSESDFAKALERLL